MWITLAESMKTLTHRLCPAPVTLHPGLVFLLCLRSQGYYIHVYKVNLTKSCYYNISITYLLHDFFSVVIVCL